MGHSLGRLLAFYLKLAWCTNALAYNTAGLLLV
jgi:hypothetical protein